jgi:hypothetical protein
LIVLVAHPHAVEVILLAAGEGAVRLLQTPAPDFGILRLISDYCLVETAIKPLHTF